MVRKPSLLAAASAIAAAFSLVATPVAALELPAAGRSHVSAGGDVSGAAPSAYGRRRHRDGIDVGDVLTGVLILGGIAAIASAASKPSRREPDYRNPQPREDYRYRDRDDRPVYRDRQPSNSSYNSGGIDNAVNMCLEQVERGDDRVGSVDNASRTADGWRISGQLSAGGGFDCWIDNDGRIRSVDLGDGEFSYAGAAGEDRQYDDAYYARARADLDYDAQRSEIDGDLQGAG